MRKVYLFTTVLITILIVSCSSYIAVALAPSKKADVRHTESRENATDFFWKTFRSGSYSDISDALDLLKKQYLNNPKDPQLALYIAHLHFWRVAERFRLEDKITPNITDDLTVSIKYFVEAKKLNPKDARIDGWLAGVRMAEATIHNDEKDKRAAYYQGLQSIENYPEFNYFSIGYVFSDLDHDSKKFMDAINWYFKTMDIAYHTEVDRSNPDVTPYLHLAKNETNQRLKKAVWNSEVAPYNVEGFYLNLGDFLVKSGEIEKARIIYNNAKKTSSYSRWPYRYLLEDRLDKIKSNTENFRMQSDHTNPRSTTKEEIIYKRMIFNSYNCMVCHQAK